MPCFLWFRCAAGLLLLGAVACTSPPRAEAPGGAPHDLVIDATILVGSTLQVEAANARIEYWPAQLRPWRAIVFPDGSLRADVGPTIDVQDRPGVTRMLYRAQVEALWTALGELGLGQSRADRPGAFSGNPALIRVGREEIVQILTVSAGGETWTVTSRFTPLRSASNAIDLDSHAPGENPQLRAFLRQVLALAWATDLPPEQRFSAPERYDFGPDPWARYRTPPPAAPGQ